jgi:predicted nucleotide-binding protein (sugar kinase/HSP70/actin superfamily)
LIEPFADKFLIPAIRFRDGRQSVERSLLKLAQRLGVSKKRNRNAIEVAFSEQNNFEKTILEAGLQAFDKINEQKSKALVLLGRPYNIYDRGVNLNIPFKLRQNFGVNIIPLDFLPISHIDVSDVHENMYWNYGRKILQAAKFVGQFPNLKAIYFTNFKCGPDSYIKHFIQDAMAKPFLVLQFDGHGNDAGYMTRCEAYLRSSNILDETHPIQQVVQNI